MILLKCILCGIVYILAAMIPDVTSFTCPGIASCACSRSYNSDNGGYDIIECSEKFNLHIINYNLINSSALRTFKVSNSEQTHLPANAFGNLQLETVSIKDQVTKIDKHAFDSISNSLKTLHLENVNITKSWNLTFLGNLTGLETLYLDGNGIYPEHFPNSVFRKLNLTSLKYLSLRHCGISLMEERALEALPNLETLDLSNNYLTRTVPKTILHLHNLRVVNLSYNSLIIYVEDHAFKTLTKLKEIDMSHTGVNTLLESSFHGLENCLKVIQLHHANMEHGFFYTMRKLRRLKTLDISYNKITEMLNTSFISFKSLSVLDISGQRDGAGNGVTSLNLVDSVFRGLELKLKVLKLRDLQLTSLPIAAISPLWALRTLDISMNHFTELGDGFFYGVKARIINISNSSIQKVSSEAFDTLKPGMSIVFDNNSITNISFVLDTKPCQFMNLSFTSNPVTCDCDVIEIVSTNRVPDLAGTCADALYRGERFVDIQHQGLADNVCDRDKFHNISGCSYLLTSDSSNPSFHFLLLLSCGFVGILF